MKGDFIMKPRVKSFEELITENKQAILKDKEEMSKLEQKIDQRHSQTSSSENRAS